MLDNSKNNVTLTGTGRTVMFAHGFGCDQSMWRSVARTFASDHQVVLFDHVGAGGSDMAAYDPERYSTLHGYADDVIEIAITHGLKDIVFVGHSVSATIGVLAAVKRPDLFAGLALICPSPRYANTDTYFGGFSDQDISELLDLMDINHLDWSANLAPVVMGAGSEPELQTDWRESVCRLDPTVAKQFARVTFTSDHRAEYRQVVTPTLIIECSDDALAPREVGAYCADAIVGSRLVTLQASGHCPHMTTPEQVRSTLRDFLSGAPTLAQAA